MNIYKKVNCQLLNEKIPAYVCPNSIELGKMTALVFLEWVFNNPKGVISLPTGKTPEYFIKFLNYYKKNWKNSGVSEILGLTEFPSTSELKFVQIDEFYPFDIHHDKSFNHYIDTFYIDLLELKKENVLRIDVSNRGILKEHGIDKVFPTGKADFKLLSRDPKNQIEELQKKALVEMQEFCKEYEQKIKDLGGIGFFLGGIGYDGHIAFNVRGSSFDSETRLIYLNYETAAQSSSDLGGIENARDKSAITIGLKTITSHKDPLIIVIAAGSEKARIVQQVIEMDPSSERPASVLQTINGAKFFLTEDSSSQLLTKKLEYIQNSKEINSHVRKYLYAISIAEKKSLFTLKRDDLEKYKTGKLILEKFQDFDGLIKSSVDHILNMMKKGEYVPTNKNIIHTSPHHDDDMLGYYTVISPLVQKNKNDFVYLTSGFTSVSNKYILTLLDDITMDYLKEKKDELFTEENYQNLMKRFSKEKSFHKKEIEVEILVTNIIREYKCTNIEDIYSKVDYLKNSYFPTHKPGTKDDPIIQTIKGAMRESEVDRLWSLYDISLSNVHHLRTKFYTGDTFNPVPKIEDDVIPMINLFKKSKPDLITVAFDPVSTGPDTHFKVLQIVGEAVRMSPIEFQPEIWGYRNVWFKFEISDDDLIAYPVTDEILKRMNEDFEGCFSTQKHAEFPSWEFDGTFSKLAENIQKKQCENLRILLGEEYFKNLKNVSGYVFIKKMNREEFLKSVQALKNQFIFE